MMKPSWIRRTFETKPEKKLSKPIGVDIWRACMANPLPMDEWPYDVPGAFSILSCGFHRALWHGTAKLKNQVRETSWDIRTIYLHGCRSISMFIPLMIFQFLSIYTLHTHPHFRLDTVLKENNLPIHKSANLQNNWNICTNCTFMSSISRQYLQKIMNAPPISLHCMKFKFTFIHIYRKGIKTK